MSIEMPKGLPFSVDTWSPSSKRKRHHFLTHAHKDHSTRISSHFSYPIYSTHLTKTVLQHYLKLDESLFVGIKVGQSVAIDDPDGAFTDTAFDANHCPVLDHSLAEVRSCSDFGPRSKALSDTETKQWRIKLSPFHSTREERRVYPMYKAFIEPDLQTAHIEIINKFNPFTGFLSPTYILKSVKPLSVDQIKAVFTEEHT